MHNNTSEDDVLDEVDGVIPYTYTIHSYGADYPVDSLVKRMKSRDILVPTFGKEPTPESTVVGFQREYVWPQVRADRFIESLLLGLPVPGIFLVKEPSGELLVLDGHQRLFTLDRFYSGIIHGREYRLQNVQERFVGRTYDDLNVEDRRRLDDSIIHATIVRQDQPTEDQSSVYIIFERLNTGGLNLQPQEIRVALYHGPLVEKLVECNDIEDWRKLFGKRSTRLKDMELILRFFAFLYYADQYRSPMKDFLNRYMAKNRNLKQQSGKALIDIFKKTTTTLVTHVGADALRPVRALNAAVADSVMVGLAKRLVRGPITSGNGTKKEYEKLLNSQKYIDATVTGTSQEGNVSERIRLATEAFAKVR